jgi:flavin reductase (DIM6/NTAB) family NADH-FMN oxidoreductase RutF
MEPKLMMVAVYHNTKTVENINANLESPVLLQLLSEPLAPVVRVCGQQSGFTIDKVSRLKKRFLVAEHQNLPYLADAAGVMELQNLSLIDCKGDHDLLVGTVVWSKNLNDSPILTTTYLKERGYIR